jgi:integrase
MKLSDKLIAALTLPDGKDDVIYWGDDPKGLGFRLRRSDDRVLKSWVVAYRRADHAGARRMTLDAVLTAEQARSKAREILAKVELGGDPQGDKLAQRTAGQYTVRALVEEYVADKRAELRPRTLRDTTIYLTGSYFKTLHAMPIEKVSRRDVATCLTRIKRDHSAIVAAAARAKLSAFFVWCLRQGYINTGANPVIGTDMGKRIASRERVLTNDELAAIWRACGNDEYGKIIKLLIATGCRRAEIGDIAFSEIDLDKGVWVLPAERSKNHRAHTLPIMPMMREIIDTVPQMATRDQLFGRRGHGFANWGEGKRALDQRLGDQMRPWVLHDLRRTVATRMNDIGIAPHIVEQVLNHQSGSRRGVAGVYNRSPYEREVRNALAQWADHVRALVEGGARVVLSFPPASAAQPAS